MERILRSKEMAEIVLLPVRHHSPACAFHVERMIEAVRPEVILVEGPDNADALIPVMVHEETKAPFAIYYSYHDQSGRISEEKAHYKCYYPFLDYSPELAAFRAGKRHPDRFYRSVLWGHIGGFQPGQGAAESGRGEEQLQ